ncbi:MAG: hypothetical protein SGARI_007438, partial [Bacillariaceae sp.]
AIKKIILESEQGKFAKFGAVQNRKLLREVTTISRMTHKNIVRYYQAWVEGGSGETTNTANVDAASDAGISQEADDDDVMNTGDALATDDGDDSDDENDNGGDGWWASSPPDRDLPKEMQSRGSSSSSSDDDGSSTSWSDTEKGAEDTSWSVSNTSNQPKSAVDKYKRSSTGDLSAMLEHENDHAFAV